MDLPIEELRKISAEKRFKLPRVQAPKTETTKIAAPTDHVKTKFSNSNLGTENLGQVSGHPQNGHSGPLETLWAIKHGYHIAPVAHRQRHFQTGSEKVADELVPPQQLHHLGVNTFTFFSGSYHTDLYVPRFATQLICSWCFCT